LQKKFSSLFRGQRLPKNVAYFCNDKKTAQIKQSPNRRKFAQSGLDVMITISCDFWQFSAKKLAFFSKANVVIQFLHNLAVF
jgi:hypothetical protein